jgi:hypothetical protein
MNILKTYTLATQEPNTFLVYWTNTSKRPGGSIKVRVTAKMQDAHIAAELAAMQHLLEEKCVIGSNLVGNANTQLVVSLGAIKKLRRCQSDKSHLAPYANFLTTRFAGCPISVDKDTRWFDGYTLGTTENLLVSGPRRETLKVTGLGDVAVTQHVLNRFADRFLSESCKDKLAQTAWKKLKEIAADPAVREVTRQGLWVGVKYAYQKKQQGRYFLNGRRNLVLVVTDNPGEGKRLVTAYPATQQFRVLPMAA